MGIFSVDVEIGDQTGRRWQRVPVLVDTVASHTVVPRPILEALGVPPHGRRSFVMADEREVEYEFGATLLRIGDEALPVIVVFGEPDMEPLLGAQALQTFDLAVDTVRKRLVRVPSLLK